MKVKILRLLFLVLLVLVVLLGIRSGCSKPEADPFPPGVVIGPEGKPYPPGQLPSGSTPEPRVPHKIKKPGLK